MDKCPNCGNKINRMDVLCPRCGAVVEDVQVKIGLKTNKSGIPGASEFAIPKKNIPQNFIVYNEDFPSEEYEAYKSENTENESGEMDSSVYGNAAGIPESEDEHDYFVPSDTEVPPDEYDDEETDLLGSKSYVPGTLKAIKEQEETDNEDYSERYLEKIKDLPEIDDISNFDPEEYMKKYRLSKDVYGNVPAVTMPENKNFNEKVTKHYLEIEEIIPSAEETLPQEQVLAASASADNNESFTDAEPSLETKASEETSSRESESLIEQSEAQPDETLIERRYNPESAHAEHRYNSDVPRRYRKKERLERKINQGKTIEATSVEAPPVEVPPVEAQIIEASSIETQSLEDQAVETRTVRYRESREVSRTPKRNEKRRVPAVASVIIWLAVIAALFTGFFFFDRYVKTSYGNYNSFIYSITNSKIDLGTNPK